MQNIICKVRNDDPLTLLQERVEKLHGDNVTWNLFVFYFYFFKWKTSNEQIHKQIKYYNFKQMCVITFEVRLQRRIPNI